MREEDVHNESDCLVRRAHGAVCINLGVRFLGGAGLGTVAPTADWLVYMDFVRNHAGCRQQAHGQEQEGPQLGLRTTVSRE